MLTEENASTHCWNYSPCGNCENDLLEIAQCTEPEGISDIYYISILLANETSPSDFFPEQQSPIYIPEFISEMTRTISLHELIDTGNYHQNMPLYSFALPSERPEEEEEGGIESQSWKLTWRRTSLDEGGDLYISNVKWKLSANSVTENIGYIDFGNLSIMDYHSPINPNTDMPYNLTHYPDSNTTELILQTNGDEIFNIAFDEPSSNSILDLKISVEFEIKADFNTENNQNYWYINNGFVFKRDIIIPIEIGLIGCPGGLGANSGDINGDGIVDVVDLVIIANSIVHETLLPEEQFCRADINGDETLTIIDIVELVNIITG